VTWAREPPTSSGTVRWFLGRGQRHLLGKAGVHRLTTRMFVTRSTARPGTLRSRLGTQRRARCRFHLLLPAPKWDGAWSTCRTSSPSSNISTAANRCRTDPPMSWRACNSIRKLERPIGEFIRPRTVSPLGWRPYGTMVTNEPNRHSMSKNGRLR